MWGFLPGEVLWPGVAPIVLPEHLTIVVTYFATPQAIRAPPPPSGAGGLCLLA